MTDGWQPAIDNLQSQINSIDSQISVLQQQVVKGNTLVDLSGASLSLVNPSTVTGIQPITTLSMPASPNIDGKILRLSLVMKVSDDGNSNTNLGGFIVFGNSSIFSSPSLGQYQIGGMSGSGVGNGVAFAEVDFVWDSVSQSLAISSTFVSGHARSQGNPSITVNSGFLPYPGNPGISSQSQIQLSFGARWDNTSNPASLTFTQLKLSLV